MSILLIMLALTLLAHGLLVVADLELRASRAGVAALGADLAARSAWSVGFRDDSLALDSVPIWGRRARVLPAAATVIDGPGARAFARTARWTRLSRERWLLEGSASGGVAERAVARPVWRLDPVARILGSAAVVMVADSVAPPSEGVVDRVELGTVPTRTPAWSCDPIFAALDSVGWIGLPVSGHAAADDVTALGELDLAALTLRADVEVAGSGTPVPVLDADGCRPEAWNWGDPGGDGSCGQHVPVVRVEDGTTVVGGVGQGLLLLQGSAELVETRFYGVVVARDSLVLRAGARVTGLVRAAGGVRTDGSGGISGSMCWAAGGLSGAALRGLSAVPNSGTIRLR